MKCVIIESPYGSPVPETRRANVKYAQLCMYDALHRGEAPFLSHLLYPQCLFDSIPAHRKMGMEAGWHWMQRADEVIIYADRGISVGMQMGVDLAERCGKRIVSRLLGRQE